MIKQNATVGTYGEMVMARAGTFVGAAGYCDTFSGPGYTELDILKNGTTIYSTKPSFGSVNLGTNHALSVTTFAAADRITFKVHSNANGNSQGIRFTLKCKV